MTLENEFHHGSFLWIIHTTFQQQVLRIAVKDQFFFIF